MWVNPSGTGRSIRKISECILTGIFRRWHLKLIRSRFPVPFRVKPSLLLNMKRNGTSVTKPPATVPPVLVLTPLQPRSCSASRCLEVLGNQGFAKAPSSAEAFGAELEQKQMWVVLSWEPLAMGPTGQLGGHGVVLLSFGSLRVPVLTLHRSQWAVYGLFFIPVKMRLLWVP